ncbi:MAG: family 78 glycoside hydrolase catalytic domain [bacterium]|nr:family 78 glycoside hydrolase catalytic domain [bacterium]
MSRIVRLRTEYQQHPLAVDQPAPVFSWQAEECGRDWRQLSYRLRVWQDQRLLWDSGVVHSAQMHHVAYAGEKLQSFASYWWQLEVTAESRDGVETLHSETAHFMTAAMEQSAWQASWIGDGEDERYHIFRCTFRAGMPVKRAVMYVCGLGQSVCAMNGAMVSDAVLEPGWTEYRTACLYAAYDVTRLIRTGENAMAVMLGDGMYNVRGGRYVYFPRSYGKRKMMLELHIAYEDGTREKVLSGSDWLMGESPLQFGCIYGGEDYDGRISFLDASLPGAQSGQWEPVRLTGAPEIVLRSRTIPPEKVMQTYTPVSVTPLPGGRWRYDLGTNFSGWVRIRIKTDGTCEGRRVVMTPGEILDAAGEVDQRVTGRGYAWTYICSAKKTQIYAPQFSYTGFRYVVVSGACPVGEAQKHPELPVLESLTGEFVYPEMEAAGSFDCDSKLLMDIHQIIRQAMLSNIKSYFTDCPHREKLPWLEETHLIGPAMLCNWNLEALYEKVEADMQDAQRDSGLVADVCPEYVTGFDRWHKGFVDSPEWGSAIVLNPWHLYARYGNTRLLRSAYPAMKRYVDYLTSRAHHHVLHHGLGDWLDIGPCTPYSQNTPVPVTATCIYYMDLGVMEKAARLLNLPEDADGWRRLREQVFEEYNAQFLDDQTGRYANGSQACQAMSLMAGLVPESVRDKAVRQLRDEVVKRSYAITAGDVGHPYLVAALMREDMHDVLNTMTNITDTPGYGYQVKHGATTLTEEWDGPDPARPHGSQNHLMLGSIDEWFYAGLGGVGSIRTWEDIARVTVSPHFAQGLTRCSVWCAHPHGRLAVSWAREEQGITLRVTVPPNTEATVSAMGRVLSETAGSGEHTYWIQYDEQEDKC